MYKSGRGCSISFYRNRQQDGRHSSQRSTRDAFQASTGAYARPLSPCCRPLFQFMQCTRAPDPNGHRPRPCKLHIEYCTGIVHVGNNIKKSAINVSVFHGKAVPFLMASATLDCAVASAYFLYSLSSLSSSGKVLRTLSHTLAAANHSW